MSRHDDFCGELADYMFDDYDPKNPICNDDISTFSSHPVDWSWELTEPTLLGKGDKHDEVRFSYYRSRINEIMSGTNKGRDESRDEG